MRLTFLKGVVLGAGVAAATMTATSALAGSGVGGVFNLGQTNTVNASTGLTGKTAGPMLSITNRRASPAMALRVGRGAAPLTVNSATEVKNLNVGRLGGLGPARFVQGGGQARAFGRTVTDLQGTVTLLTIPGYGRLTAFCDPVIPGPEVTYINGPHSVDIFTENPVPAVVHVPAAGMTEILGVSPQPSWQRAMIRYATASGQHVATIQVAANVNADTTTCQVLAEEYAGPSRAAP